jgi:hypothetical protein
MQQSFAPPLAADALADNRAGRLTKAQRDVYRRMSHGWRKTEFQFAGIFALIGVLIWFADGSAGYATIKPLLGIGFLILAGVLLVVGLTGSDPITRDVREGRVLQVEGAIRKYTESSTSRGSSTTYHYAEVANVRTETGSTTYDALPGAGIVRLFYLPHSRRLVNFEQLADRALPEGALTDPRVALEAGASALFGDADARAELAAIGRQLTASGAPPPPSERDQRPLAAAIVGTWKNPLITATFDAGGSVSLSLPGRQQRSGRWSVDPSGRLVVDVMGTDEAAEAWIANDRLSVKIGGEGVTLVRA